MKFSPGFRISGIDITVIVTAILGAVFLYRFSGEYTFIILFVVSHFFLFCNVLRVSRPPELIWASLFVILGFSVKIPGILSWYHVCTVMLIATGIIILVESRRASYHGILWKRLNPDLENRFNEKHKDNK